MIRLIIADDHAIVRDGLKQLFMLTQDIVVSKEATNSAEVMEHILDSDVDFLLLDMNMPGKSGIELIGLVKSIRPDLHVLIFTMHNEVSLVNSAFKAGASGYFTKSSSPKLLLAAIRKVAAGGKYIDPELAEQIVFQEESSQRNMPHDLLSDRELEVFRLLVSGKSVNQIAEQLFISNKTVSAHKVNLQRKLNVNSMVDLVHYAMQSGIA